MYGIASNGKDNPASYPSFLTAFCNRSTAEARGQNGLDEEVRELIAQHVV
jgi:hypothetical protein